MENPKLFSIVCVKCMFDPHCVDYSERVSNEGDDDEEDMLVSDSEMDNLLLSPEESIKR